MGTDKNIKLHIVTDIKFEMKPWWILISLCMASWEVCTMHSNGDVLTLIKQLERRITRVEKEVQHTKEALKAEIKKAKGELKREIGTHRRKNLCGDILHHSPIQRDVRTGATPPAGWIMCYIDHNDAAYYNTPCNGLLVNIAGMFKTSTDLLNAGGNFGFITGEVESNLDRLTRQII